MMRRNRRPAWWLGGLVFGLVVAAFAALLVACGDDDDDDNGDSTPGGNGGQLREVTFMLDWTPNTNHAGIYIAKAKGYYEEAGLKVNIIEPGQSVTSQVVATGQADFGISVAETVIPARAEGVPLVSIAAIVQHNTSSLMSLAEDNINSPKDLAGKKYGGFGGALETALIKKLIECDGGDPNGFQSVEIGNVDFLIGMKQNSYDYVWIFDAWDGVRAKEVEGVAVNTIPFIDHTDCIPDWYTPVIITNEDHIKNDPDLVRDFMAATAKGYADAIADPQASYDAIIAAAPETDEKLLLESAKYLQTRYVDEGRKWGQQDADVWSRFEEFLREAGLTEKEVDTSKAFTNEFIP